MSRRRGFTLLELMVCIGIFSVLLLITVPTFHASQASFSGAQCSNDIAAQIRYLQALALHNESYTYMVLNTDNFQTYQELRTPGGSVYPQMIRNYDLTYQYGYKITLGNTGTIGFRPTGFTTPTAQTQPATFPTEVLTTMTPGATSTTINGTVVSISNYTVTCSTGNGHSYYVTIGVNGKVTVGVQ